MAFRSFKIERFRCFRNLNLQSVAGINLITGRNNVGKTALLEAIFLQLAPGNPELSVRLNVFRGVERASLEPDDLWGWLFYRRSTKQPIRLIATTDADEMRTLTVSLGDRTRLTAPDDFKPDVPESVSTSAAGPTRDLILSFLDSSGKRGEASASVKPNGQIEIKGADLSQQPGGVFVLSHRMPTTQDAERFSRLDDEGRGEDLVPILKVLEPRLERLKISVNGGVPSLKADIGIGRLIPLSFLGEGISRLLSYLLAINNARGGVVLIDEFENGFHHTVLPTVWRAVATAAQMNRVQVFATTHSWENVQAAHKAFSEFLEYGLTLFRLERSDEDIRAVHYDREALEGAAIAEFEVR